jgi:hypothetical protein
MSFKDGALTADLDRQIELLKHFPEVLNKHFYPAMGGALKMLRTEIVPEIPVLTGRARAAFRTRVSGRGLRIQGRAGWWGSGQPWYINIVEYGARAHDIVPRHGHEFLHFGDTFVRAVSHPGFPAREFMKRGLADAGADITLRFWQAAESTLNDLEIH